jgi:hypothetical protein
MMAKISGILPANSRITTVDLRNERPVRNSAPDFGLPTIEKIKSLETAPVDQSVVRAISEQAVDLSRKELNPVADSEMAKLLPKPTPQKSEAEQIDAIADSFFAKRAEVNLAQPDSSVTSRLSVYA